MKTKNRFDLISCFILVILFITAFLLCPSKADAVTYSYKTADILSEPTVSMCGKYFSMKSPKGTESIYVSETETGKGTKIFSCAKNNELVGNIVTNGKTLYCITRNYNTQKDSIYKVDIAKKTTKRLKTISEDGIIYDLKGYSSGKLIVYGYSNYWMGDMITLSNGERMQRFSMMTYDLKSGKMKKVTKGHVFPEFVVKGNYVYGTAVEDIKGVKKFTFAYNTKTEKITKINSKYRASYIGATDKKLYYRINNTLYSTNLSGTGKKVKELTLSDSSYINALKDNKLFYLIRFDENWTYDEPQYMVYDFETKTKVRVEADQYAEMSGITEWEF